MYGELFKKLRLERKISLSKAASDITSLASLSRWENGQGEMDITKVVRLLSKLGLSPHEFFTLDDSYVLTDILQAYNSDNLKKLRLLITERTELFHKNPSNEQLLIQVAAGCNLYFDLTDINLLSPIDQKRIQYHLSNLTSWTQTKVCLLGNSILLIPAKQVFAFSMLLLNDLDEIKKTGYLNYLNALLTLLNSTLSLIQRSQSYAKKLLDKFEKITLTETFSFISTTREFYKELLLYSISGNNSNLKSFYQALDIVGLSSLKKDFKESEIKINKLYFSK